MGQKGVVCVFSSLPLSDYIRTSLGPSEVTLPHWIYEQSCVDCHSSSDPVLRSTCEFFRFSSLDVGTMAQLRLLIDPRHQLSLPAHHFLCLQSLH